MWCMDMNNSSWYINHYPNTYIPKLWLTTRRLLLGIRVLFHWTISLSGSTPSVDLDQCLISPGLCLERRSNSLELYPRVKYQQNVGLTRPVLTGVQVKCLSFAKMSGSILAFDMYQGLMTNDVELTTRLQEFVLPFYDLILNSTTLAQLNLINNACFDSAENSSSFWYQNYSCD